MESAHLVGDYFIEGKLALFLDFAITTIFDLLLMFIALLSKVIVLLYQAIFFELSFPQVLLLPLNLLL